MKLTKILVSNFRGIGGDELEPGIEIDFEDIDLVFLIGQNNTGKSSVLHAYEYFVLSRIEAKMSDFHKRNLNPIVIEGWIQTESDEDRDHQAIKKSVDEQGVARFRKVWTTVGGTAQKFTYNTETSTWEAGGGGGFDSLLQNACPEPIWLKGLDGVDIILEKVQKLIKEKVIDQASELQRFNMIKQELERLREDVIRAEYSQKLQGRLNEMMQETFPDLSVSLFGEQKDDIAKKLYNFIQTDINFSNRDGHAVDMSNHGHGIRRQFLFNSLRGLSHVFKELDKAKAQRDLSIIDNIDQGSTQFKKKMLLIEEPELFLHPQSVRMFAKTLYDLVSRDSGTPEFQIMAATHSPILIDLSRDHTTLLKTHINDEGAVCLNQVKSSIFDDEEKERMKMLNTFNPYVCEAFFNDSVILVEGDTEAVVFRELLNKFVELGKINFNKVPLIVNCGTKNNIPSFQKVLGHFGICYSVIHDLDDTYKANGSLNSAWTLNEKIYDEIVTVNDCLKARRYVMERNFEDAHGYTHSSSLGKPLSAYRLVQGWDVDSGDILAVEALKFCLEYNEDVDIFDDMWVASKATEIPVG